MAERWQLWMPFHIDRFRGSPDVQAMHPAARAGYLYLLASAWQSEDCTLPNDPFFLASASGLGDDLWAQYSPRIMRKFPPIDGGGPLRNEVLYIEWLEAKRIFEARSASARETTRVREQRRKPTVTAVDSNGDRSLFERPADTGTLTGTLTEEQKPLPQAAGFVLPAWIDRGTWDEFEAMRKKMRKPLTDRARELIIGKLVKLEAKGHKAELVLNNSILNAWQDVYEPKDGRNGQITGNSRSTRNQSAAEAAKQRVRDRHAH